MVTYQIFSRIPEVREVESETENKQRKESPLEQIIKGRAHGNALGTALI